MRTHVLILLLLLLRATGYSQINLIPEVGQRFIHLYNWVEHGNSYYFLTYEEGSSQNTLTNSRAIEYTINKYDKYTHQFQGAEVIAGDTAQADSIISYFGPTLVIKDDKMHFAFTKQIPDGIVNRIPLYYMQLDTNLNITVSERRLEEDMHMQSMIAFNTDKVLIYYFAFDTMLAQGSMFSKYQILDGIGNTVKEDTFEYKPTFVQGGFLGHTIAEVIPYDEGRYLVSGMDFLGQNTGRGFYLADSNLAIIDTFKLKPTFFTSGTYSGSFPRYPNLVSLPTGSLIGGGQYNTGGHIYTILTKHRSSSRFSIDTSVVYDAKDINDQYHVNVASIHSMEYNEYDNRIYYSTATHTDSWGSCGSDYNYVQVISTDTNLNTKWRIFIEHAPDSCATVTKVSKPFGRPGVLVVGTTHNINHATDTAYTSHFVYYIDSTGGPLSVVEASGVRVRNRVVVFPNPATSTVTINDILGGLEEVQIYNIQGTLVSRKELSGKEATINIASLPAGMYMLRLFTNDGECTLEKIVKQ